MTGTPVGDVSMPTCPHAVGRTLTFLLMLTCLRAQQWILSPFYRAAFLK